MAVLTVRYLRPPRAVRAEAIDADGTRWPLIVDTDGTVSEAGPPRRPKKTNKPRKAKARSAPQTKPAAVPVPATPSPIRLPMAAVIEASATTRIRPSTPNPRPTPVVEQHERSDQARLNSSVTQASASSPPRPAIPEPTRTVRIRRAAAPAPRKELPSPATGPKVSLIPSYLRIRSLAEAGDLEHAAQMALELDNAAARTNGPSHPSALEAREVRAHITAERGHLAAAVDLYRDVAERWALQGQQQAANEAAARAHALWMRITDAAEAVRAGEAVVRMRTQIPGENGKAYRQAARRLQSLQSEQSQTRH